MSGYLCGIRRLAREDRAVESPQIGSGIEVNQRSHWQINDQINGVRGDKL
jgi:hypothetical protein